VAVKIRLKRLGKIRAPYYRVVIADSRTKRDGRAIEEIGKYHPTEEPSLIDIDSARAQYWLGVGAQPTEQVMALLKVTGDWQKFKGLPGAEGTLRVAAPKVDKKAVFEIAAKEAMSEPKDAPKARKKAEAKPAKADEAPAAEAPVVEAPAAEVPVVEAPAAEVPVVEAPAAEAPAAEAPAEVVEAAVETAAVEDAPATSEQVEAAADEVQAEG
jgi:small subunit ribosomal protein S16